ncbi:CII family transcriptional regulator [Escherichia coli]|nr:CII family transcriptional regulator [Escherichia coli]MDT8590314.1 CII family transcriptional regulator [Escherichia coli]
MAQASYSKLTQREIDRAETDLLINLSITKEKRKVNRPGNPGD